ncbi:GNAT family N-acetyltransferase [Trinickia terrae]|uniref:GNAT family N-acetyltransferase n=1 Tax=Trinickia terrae TaxID=2571161 RepID=UPI00146C4623|nr:GNAT family N-acetyltransferase [Trinickia terrae]
MRASTASDRDFLHAVYASTRTAEFASAGWSPTEIHTLLAGQFTTQDAYYHRHYPHGRFDVVLSGGTAIGRLYHDWSGREAHVIDIALLPAWRGAGIGTRLMRVLVAEAARRAIPMCLHVEFDNPVRSLYRRLGFVPVGENGVYEQMRRDAAPFGGDEPEPLPGFAAGAA